MTTIRELDGAEALARSGELAEVLRDCVEGGASVGFMLPLAEGPRGLLAQGGCGRRNRRAASIRR